MTEQELEAIIGGIAPVVREYIERITAPLMARIDELEQRALVAGPVGPQGEPGAVGATGRDGVDGKDGAPGREGRDGQPGVPGTQGEKGIDGTHGRDGKDGRDGFDGLGFDDVSVAYDGARQFTVQCARNDRVKAFPFTIPLVLYRGVFAAGTSYEQGDAVTFGGSTWIARAATAAKPGDGATDWQLAVKVGRDGKDGKPGINGTNGRDGKDGKSRW